MRKSVGGAVGGGELPHDNGEPMLQESLLRTLERRKLAICLKAS